MESAREDSIGDEDDDNDIKEWETSFIEKKPVIKQNNIGIVLNNDLAALDVGPMVIFASLSYRIILSWSINVISYFLP